MLQIEITQSGSVPRFLVRAPDAQARLVIFSVQELNEDRDHTWTIGPVGSDIAVRRASVHIVESQPATAEELESFGMDEESGAPPPVIDEFSYGEVPPGFYQAHPVGDRPRPLVLGKRYIALAVAGDELGLLEFVA